METTLKPFLELFEEVYIGSDNEQTWIIDGNPGHGITAALKQVSADIASKPTVKGGTSIVGHAEHLRWSLDYAYEFFEGKQPTGKWEDSWKLRMVNQPAWDSVQQDLLESYEKIKSKIEETSDWSNPDLLKGALALLPHAAYHLGAIKQMLLVLNEEAALKEKEAEAKPA